METEKTLHLNALFDEIVQALEANDHRKVAELEFISQSIQDTLSPEESHTHMVHYICMVTQQTPEELIEDVASICGSHDPIIQNEHISDILRKVTEMIDEDNAAHGFFPIELSGPKGMQ